MTVGEFHQKLTNINVWKRGEQRAPHKPLLLLLAMGRAVRGDRRLALFSEIEEPLTGLLRHFGPPRRTYHPEHPFRYLANNGLWEIPNASLIRETRGWGKKALRDHGILGGLPKSLYRTLVDDPASAREAADLILKEHFPVSMHQHILETVGLEGAASNESAKSRRLPRDPSFRHSVLTAYERRCAICEFDLRLNDDLLGLEAAHIQWHSHGGPDRVNNGLALCSFHHGAFDRGAIGLEKTGGAGYRMLVSADVNGTSAAVRWLLDYHGQPVRPPQKGAGEPHKDYVAWHTKEVFRSPPRGL